MCQIKKNAYDYIQITGHIFHYDKDFGSGTRSASGRKSPMIFLTLK
ncbi:MAG: hypothetical protein ACI8W0_001349, partial [Flavobacterium sp.]